MRYYRALRWPASYGERPPNTKFARFNCEHCGHTEAMAHDTSSHWFNNLLPQMACPNCNRSQERVQIARGATIDSIIADDIVPESTLEDIADAATNRGGRIRLELGEIQPTHINCRSVQVHPMERGELRIMNPIVVDEHDGARTHIGEYDSHSGVIQFDEPPARGAEIQITTPPNRSSGVLEIREANKPAKRYRCSHIEMTLQNQTRPRWSEPNANGLRRLETIDMSSIELRVTARELEQRAVQSFAERVAEAADAVDAMQYAFREASRRLGVQTSRMMCGLEGAMKRSRMPLRRTISGTFTQPILPNRSAGIRITKA